MNCDCRHLARAGAAWLTPDTARCDSESASDEVADSDVSSDVSSALSLSRVRGALALRRQCEASSASAAASGRAWRRSQRFLAALTLLDFFKFSFSS
jgi:hypothetical protein